MHVQAYLTDDLSAAVFSVVLSHYYIIYAHFD